MSDWVECSSQAEVDRAILHGDWPIVRAGYYEVSGSASVSASGSASVRAYDSASVSAQLRHLRKPRFGAYMVDRRYDGDGLYSYRVRRPEPSVESCDGRLFA